RPDPLSGLRRHWDGPLLRWHLRAAECAGRSGARRCAMTASCSALTRKIVACGEVQIEVLTQGQGHPIVLLPSLGRGAEDFDAIAERLAAASFRVLRPQPRGIGESRGAMTGIDL